MREFVLANKDLEFYWNICMRNLDDAKFASKHDRIYIAIGRAYYAMFWAAKALLYQKGEPDYKNHGKVIGAFGRLFAKTKIVDPKFHKFLDNAFRMRLQADYGIIEPITRDDMKLILQQAEEFCNMARELSINQ